MSDPDQITISRRQLRETRGRLPDLKRQVAKELDALDRLLAIQSGDLRTPKEKVFQFVSPVIGTRTIDHGKKGA